MLDTISAIPKSHVEKEMAITEIDSDRRPVKSKKRSSPILTLVGVVVAIAAIGFLARNVLRERDGLEEHHATDDALKVATWNVQWFPGQNPKPTSEEKETHFKTVVEAIGKLDADILCLQEVHDVEALERLAEATGYAVQTRSDFRGTQEIAILSRFPAIASFSQEFEKKERLNTPPRGFAYAHFQLPTIPNLHVYSVHLKSNAGGCIEKNTPKREEAAHQLVTHVEAVDPEGDDILVICGDFNMDPTQDGWKNDETLEILNAAGFAWTGVGDDRANLLSWLSDGRYPDAVFDHILVRGGGFVSGAETMKTGRDVSDHRAVFVAIPILIPRFP